MADFTDKDKCCTTNLQQIEAGL